ncbi:MAG: heme exporter protein CcmA [Caulobacteraceae bacterium]|nr:heme exporter protein CcmA [Caulobacteraceae bacterium]
MIRTLRIEDLALSRGERRLFEGFSLTLSAGEAIALVGANGAGKTSLLRAFAGFLGPGAGVIGFDGEGGPIEPDEARGLHLHMLGHHDGLKTGRLAREELLFQARWTGGDEAAALQAARELDIVRLLDLEVRKLSAGQRRRLALARLVASPRPLWLLDEPMAPLDAAQRARFGEILGRHIAGGGMVVAAVHDPLPIPCRIVEVGG